MSEIPSSSDGPILAAVNFSEDSRLALIWAARQAQLEAAPLVILHVVHDPAASPGFYHKPDEDWLRPMFDVAEEMMAAFHAKATADHPELSALAPATIRLGSVAERVAQLCGAPVVIVKATGSEAAR